MRRLVDLLVMNVLVLKSYSYPFSVRMMSRNFLLLPLNFCLNLVSRLMIDFQGGLDVHRDIFDIEAGNQTFFRNFYVSQGELQLTLQAASIVLQSVPLDGSQLKTCAMNLSCAVCMMNAQFFTFFPIPKKLRYRTRHSCNT